MGMNLVSETGERTWFRLSAWSKVLQLARMYGWEPYGTTIPKSYMEEELEWDGGYGTNEGQLVEAHDALKLAEALARALSDIPDEKPSDNPYVDARSGDPQDMEATIQRMIAYSPLDYFGGHKIMIEGLIKFCKLGAFEIW